MNVSELWQHLSNLDEPVVSELKNSLKYAMVVLAPVGIGAYGIKHLGQSVQTNDHAPPTTNMVLEIIAILTAIVVLCFAADRVGTYFVPEGDYRIITHLVLFLVIADSSIGRGVRKIVQWGVSAPPDPPITGNEGDQVVNVGGNGAPLSILRPQPTIRQPTTISGGDIRPPPQQQVSVGPGQQPEFNDMYGGYETPNSGMHPNEIEAFGGW